MDLTLETTDPGYARFRLLVIAEAAGRLAPKVQVKYLLAKVRQAERIAAAHSRCELDQKIDVAQNFGARIRRMGGLDKDVDILHAWEMTAGRFEERFDAFLCQLSFSSRHQELAAHMRVGELKPFLDDLSMANQSLQHSRDQVHILEYSLKSLKSFTRYQARIRNNENVKRSRLPNLIKRLRYSFPHIDWPNHLAMR